MGGFEEYARKVFITFSIVASSVTSFEAAFA
jgi:hypothetical protein